MKKILPTILLSTLLLTGCSTGGSPLFIALENSGESVVEVDTRQLYPEAESVYISCTNNKTALSDTIGTADLTISHLRDDHKNWIIAVEEDDSVQIEGYNKFIVRLCDIDNTQIIQEVTDTTITLTKNNGVWELTPSLS